MEIATKDHDSVKIVYIPGQLDTNTSPDVQNQLDQLINEGAILILINLKDLNYISSAGLRILLATAKQLKNSSGELRICCLNEMAQEVFDISGFNNILNVFNTEEEALKDFNTES